MDLFKFLPHFFSDSSIYNKLNNNERSKYFFMTNRFSAIMFPHIVNNFNHLEINSGQAVNSLHDIFKRFGSVPQWLWAGVKKTKTTTKKIEVKADDEIVAKYLEIYEISYKEFERLSELYPNELQMELNEISESLINQINKN